MRTEYYDKGYNIRIHFQWFKKMGHIYIYIVLQYGL